MKLFGILAVIGLFIYNPAPALTPCDATTGASVKVKSITTTLNSAAINYTEGRTNGTRNIQFGIGTLGTIHKVQTRNKSVHPETMTGLTANTKYMYRFSAVWGGNQNKSVVTGTFTTDGTACGELVETTGKVDGYVFNQLGDTLQNVAVAIESGNQKIAFDTTDEKGYYTIDVKPGSNYKLSCTYAPYTSPAMATVPTVVLSKTYRIPNQVMTGAFQLSGTVRLTTGGAGVDSAIVTITHKTDASKNKTLRTDETGQFELGMLAGDYTIMAALGGKTLPLALSIPITTKSIKLPDLILSSASSIKLFPKHGKFTRAANPGYNANGSLQGNKTSNPVQMIRFSK